MGWDNPPVPWREFERRLSWGKGTAGGGGTTGGKGADQESAARPGRGSGAGGEKPARRLAG